MKKGSTWKSRNWTLLLQSKSQASGPEYDIIDVTKKTHDMNMHMTANPAYATTPAAVSMTENPAYSSNNNMQ